MIMPIFVAKRKQRAEVTSKTGTTRLQASNQPCPPTGATRSSYRNIENSYLEYGLNVDWNATNI